MSELSHAAITDAATGDPNFFFLWLAGKLRVYSHGFFEDDAESLKTGMERKFRHAFDASGIQPGQRMLDIGGGWGSFLQRCGLLLLVSHYSRHHLGNHDRNYCLINGWADRSLGRLGLFRGLEWVIARWREAPGRSATITHGSGASGKRS